MFYVKGNTMHRLIKFLNTLQSYKLSSSNPCNSAKYTSRQKTLNGHSIGKK